MVPESRKGNIIANEEIYKDSNDQQQTGSRHFRSCVSLDPKIYLQLQFCFHLTN